MDAERFRKQMDFVIETDRLKQVFRQTYLMDETRKENDAEHSWHLAIMAVLLAEYSNHPGIDLARVLTMVLIHDIVEIDAGDAYCYDEGAQAGKLDREMMASQRVFGMLPDDQAERMRALWNEFEAGETPEARFAAALDRFQPLLHNYRTRGKAWIEHGINSGQVMRRCSPIGDGSEELWRAARALIMDAVEQGYLAAGPGAEAE